MRAGGTARVLATLLVTLRVVALVLAVVVVVRLVEGGPLGLERLLPTPSSIEAVIPTSAEDRDAVAAPGRRELRFVLQGLLAHDTMLAGRFMRSTLSGDPAFVDAANAVLVRSTDDLERTLARVLPPEDARTFAEGWAAHTQGLFAYASALRDGDDVAREDARRQLAASVAEQAATLADLTGGAIAEDAAATSLQMRVDLLLYQIDAHARGDHEQAYELAREAYAHTASFASTLAAGVTGHDPRAVDAGDREQLRADLARLLGEHVELSTDTLRATVTGSDEFDAAAGALDDNSNELADLMAGTLGDRRARRLGRLWAANADQLLRYGVAVAERDAAGRRTLRDDLRVTAERFGRQFARATRDETDPASVTETLRSQQLLLLEQIDAYARADYAAAHDTAAGAHLRATDLARTMTGGLVTIVRTRMPQGGADTGGGGTAGVG